MPTSMKRGHDLDRVHRCLAALVPRGRVRPYRVPASWNCWGYREADRLGRGEIAVQPHRFLVECLERVVFPARGRRKLAGRSLSEIQGVRRLPGGKVLDGRHRRRGGDWLRHSNIYSMLVRTATAWDHDADGQLRCRRWTETGTFLKSILLVPLLARMGFDVLYLLPISRCSRMFRKGEVGCPYAAKNFFRIEPDLHDRLLGRDESQVEMEFGAFVEAAHAMGMRVMVDLAPRTASRDNDLILDHPDWFYWIDRKHAGGYGAPHVEGVHEPIPRPSELGRILTQGDLREHLARFRFAPNVSEPLKWARFVRRCRAHPPANLYREIGRTFGVMTPPGFSDCINDAQPPWSDVTFLRLFLDHPTASVKHLVDPQNQPPYVFTDTIKASRFPGRRPNRPLWRVLADILPFYQRFGVDGARVDMGHALPAELQKMILDRPRRRDPDFGFLAEEFSHDHAGIARRDGYNAIIGLCWDMESRATEGALRRLTDDVLPATKLPSLATSEIPDSPRATVREGGRAFAKLTAVLNCFLPNAVPFVNNGFEVFERQPMNLGLDPCPPGRFALPQSDPYYGKLAFFDRVALHWMNRGAAGMIDLLGRAAQVRRRFLVDLVQLENHFVPRIVMNARSIIAVGWRVEAGRSLLLVVANVDFKRRRRCVIADLPMAVHARPICETLLGIGSPCTAARLVFGHLRFTLEPGGVAVCLVTKVC